MYALDVGVEKDSGSCEQVDIGLHVRVCHYDRLEDTLGNGVEVFFVEAQSRNVKD